MIRVCPHHDVWVDFTRKLSKISAQAPEIPRPPIALILADWACTDDFEKKHRWDETLGWIEKFGGSEYITCLTDDDFYYVTELQRSNLLSHSWGPTVPPATKPSDEDLSALLKLFKSEWAQIAGDDSKINTPIRFSGSKARSLIVEYDTARLTSGGTWGNDFGGYRDQKFTAKLKFTPVRARWVAAEIWHPDQRGSFDESGAYILEFPYSDDRELLLDIAKHGAAVEVLSPKVLRDKVRKEHEAAYRQYARWSTFPSCLMPPSQPGLSGISAAHSAKSL